MKAIIIVCVLIFMQIDQCVRSYANLLNDATRKSNSTILSRKRRYLVFPEGSSFQVVFDLTYPSVALEGNVFVFGHTAAMAWELPSTPIFLDTKKMKEQEEKTETATIKPAHEFSNNFEDLYTHDWKPPLLWDYSEGPNSPITHHTNLLEDHHQHFLENEDYTNNDYFGSQESHNQNSLQFWNKRKIDRIMQSNLQKPPTFQAKQMKRTIAHHIQRRSRRELYTKVEKLLTALSKDGKSCVLKAICQVNKLSSRKGTLWEEIVKAVFKAKHDMHPDEDYYDKAANLSHDCDKTYPTCDGHVLSNLFRNKRKK